MKWDEYRDGLAEAIRTVSMEIAALEADESLAPMESSVKVAELEAKRCSSLMDLAMAEQDFDGARKWNDRKDSWHQRLRIAVSSRSQDLLPKILARQERDRDVGDALENLK